MPQLKFICYAKCVPQGSSSAFIKNGRAIVTSANKKLKPFRKAMSLAASIAMQEHGHDGLLAPQGEPVGVSLDIYFDKPKSASRRQHCTVKPDCDKLVRSCFDSMTGIVWHDDAQVVELFARKHYGPERIEVSVYTL